MSQRLSQRHSLRSRVVAVAALALLSPTAAVVAAAPAQAAGGVTITKVSPGKDWGGLSAFIQTGCAVQVEFTDASPSEDDAYVVRVVTQAGVELEAGAWGDEGKFTGIVDCHISDFVDGEEVKVEVQEKKSVTTTTWTPDTLERPVPSESTLRVKKRSNGSAKATIAYGGTWETGVTFDYQVWTTKNNYITGDDYDANQRGNKAVVASVSGAKKPLTSFVIPKRLGKRYMWVSVVARGTDSQFDTGIFWGPATVEDTQKTMPAKWVKSFGKKKGRAKVGKTVRVTKPKYSKAGSKQKLKVSYQWRAGGKKVAKGTKAKLKVTKKLRGKKLKVTITVTKAGHKSRTKKVNFGKVR